jgi:starch-binding outer membrane protein, SusD/RagB family
MKNLYKIIISFTLLILVSSCNKDLLDKTPLESLSPATFYENESESKIALIGVYGDIDPRDWHNVPIHWYQFDFMSDNNYCQDAWQGSKEFGEWTQNSSSWTAESKWAKAYSTIVRANSFLVNVEKATMSDSVKAQMKAEARFIRAYMYADLIHFYGDVPLVAEVQALETAKIARTSKSDVLTSVIADFDYAATYLPSTYSSADVGRATKGAALAFKAKALLYNENWTEAAQAAKDVMDLNVYGLFEDYAGLFEEANENNKEVIFDIQYIKDTYSQSWPTSCVSFGEWPTPNVTADLINSYYMTNGLPITDAASGYNDQDPYTNRDLRLAASVVLPGSTRGWITFIPNNDDVPCGARPRKYSDEFNTNRTNCGLNTILMRYADVLLMRAEALIESGSTAQEIYDLIDQVRARVNMPKIENVEGTGLSKEQLRQILRHERRVEFFMEGTRYADMLRWKDESLVHDIYGYNRKKLSDPSSSATWQFEQIKVVSRVFDSTKGWLWPIPQSERQNNDKLTQNPGY